MGISLVKQDVGLAKETTRKGGVVTTEGFIPHRVHPEFGIEMPVRTYPVGDSLSDMKFPPVPVRQELSGLLCYALPGGGSWSPTL